MSAPTLRGARHHLSALAGFLRALCEGCEGLVELRALPSQARHFVAPSDVDGLRRFATEHQHENVYLGVATRRDASGGDLEHCRQLPALFVDVDFKITPEPEARAALARFRLAPSAVVQSGGGLHLWWFLREPLDLPAGAARAKTMLRRLARAVGGDLAAAEPARILRLPASLNHKYAPPRPVVLESLHAERRVTLADFDFLPPEPEPARSGPFRAPEQIHEGERNTTLFRLARSLKLRGDLASGVILAALHEENVEKCQRPLSDSEVAEIHHNAMTQPDRSGFETRPAPAPSEGPQTIAAVLAPLDALPTSPSAEQLEPALRAVAGYLNGHDPLRRQAARAEAIKRLSALKVGAPTMWVDSALGLTAPDSTAAAMAGRGITLDDPEPWPEPVDGAALLETLAGLARRFVVLPTSGPETLALWVAFTHTLDACDTAPQLVLTSPTRQCGKTKCLELATALVRRALPASNLTAAAAYRVIEKYAPTMLVDEADTFLPENPELRGVLNSGHTRATAYVLRCVGDAADPRRFSTWCARAIALIGALPATMEDRSITLPMRRRVAGEGIERMRRDRLHRDLEHVRRQLARWAQDAAPALRDADPEIPEGLTDREADNWRPLLAIADVAGGPWPERARKAALTLCGVRGEDSTPGLRLLADVRQVFPATEDKIPSAVLVARLVALADRPWCEYGKGGKPLTQNGLATLLKPFGVKPHGIRVGDDTPRGYEQQHFADSFTRYLGGSKPQHPQQINGETHLGQKHDLQHGPTVADRKPDLSADEKKDVAGVAVPNLLEAGRSTYDL